jgi:hypothetical protein
LTPASGRVFVCIPGATTAATFAEPSGGGCRSITLSSIAKGRMPVDHLFGGGGCYVALRGSRQKFHHRLASRV